MNPTQLMHPLLLPASAVTMTGNALVSQLDLPVWGQFVAQVGFPAVCVFLLAWYIKQERAIEQTKRDEFVAALLADRTRDQAKRDEHTAHLLTVIREQQRVMDATNVASAAVTAAVSKIVERLDRSVDACPYRKASE